MIGLLATGAILLLHLVLLGRVLIRPHREPASRAAWALALLLFPVGGAIAYLLFGETYFSKPVRRRAIAAQQEVARRLPPAIAATGAQGPTIPHPYRAVFALASTVNGFRIVAGNRFSVPADSNETILRMAADIDAARDHVHLSFYIWLDDGNGQRIIDALIRAAGRGVQCRAIADGIGSQALVASPHWRAMAKAGVRLAVSLRPVGLIRRLTRSRIDLRNHRKIVVIDNRITYVGSQNCADPEFRVKPRYAPWVDLMVRLEGPIALEKQAIFIGDWMFETREDLVPLLEDGAAQYGMRRGKTLPAIAFSTGPFGEAGTMSAVFTTLIHAAQDRLCITTPYFVPDQAIQAALRATARRGVETALIVPRRNDSWIVRAVSRSYYAELLGAGVRIFEYGGGLLHAKTITVDGRLSLIGSSNLDRRSLELNFENNVILYGEAATSEIAARQQQYRRDSREVTLADVARWQLVKRLYVNAMSIFGPIF